LLNNQCIDLAYVFGESQKMEIIFFDVHLGMPSGARADIPHQRPELLQKVAEAAARQRREMLVHLNAANTPTMAGTRDNYLI
jgi:hypothetical protein